MCILNCAIEPLPVNPYKSIHTIKLNSKDNFDSLNSSPRRKPKHLPNKPFLVVSPPPPPGGCIS